MKSEADRVDEYISKAPGARRCTLRKLRETIKEMLPIAEEYMDHGMPAYRLGENVVAFASQKHYISVYLFYDEQRKRIADNFPGLSHGVSCVRFNEKDGFPYDALRRVL
ncbi:MAG: DUF1801 domain-containing protein, partial [Deltaproteobacteria bacterium]|nr:DUF1801 domain-containing protein [Deltaproteobacteria bacterium]